MDSQRWAVACVCEFFVEAYQWEISKNGAKVSYDFLSHGSSAPSWLKEFLSERVLLYDTCQKVSDFCVF